MKHLKKAIPLCLLALALVITITLLAPKAEAAPLTGSCGEKVTYSYENGTLTISGTGPMDNWGASDVPWYRLRHVIERIVIQNGVTTIGNNAFEHCAVLQSVSIPATVTTIGIDAFACSSLPSIAIPGSVKTVDSGAFFLCESLTAVYIEDLQAWCEISFGLFESNPLHCAHNLYLEGELLTELVIPEEITVINNNAFEGCTSLQSVTIPYSVTAIGDKAFYKCENLEAVSIPGSVTTIGENAFSTCPGLSSINIPEGVTTIGQWAFEYCTGLQSVTLPDSITIIGDYTFRDCTGLTSFAIPASVTTIGAGAFSGCSGLTSIMIPGSVTLIDTDAFNGCESLREVYYDGSESQWNSIAINYYNNYLTNADIIFMREEEPTEPSVPEDTEIKSGTCGESLTWSLDDTGTLTISGTGDMWTWDAEGAPWYGSRSSIQSVIIGYEVTNISDYAFNYCANLTSVTIPDTVTSIGSYAFSSCSGLASFAIPGSVTSIGNGAFYDCFGMQSIMIPSSITAIGESAFHECGLVEVYYDGSQSQWNSIAIGGDNRSLTNANIIFSVEEEPTEPSVPDSTVVESGTCGENLTWTLDDAGTLTISGTGEMTDWETGCAPWYSSGLSVKSVIVGYGVTSIGNSAFYECAYMTSITLPDTVTSFGDRALSVCSRLPAIVIPNSVTAIGKAAFYECYGLKSVTIPESVRSIGDSAFSYTRLSEVCYEGSQKQWNSVSIGSDNDPLIYANITFMKEDEPTEPETVTGDLTGDSAVTNDDVIALLWNVLFPEENPISAYADFNGDGNVTNDDVLLLLWHVLFPEQNPI